MSKFIAAALAGALMISGVAAAPALAQAPAAAAGAVSSKSPLKAFIADKKAMEALAKYAPQVAEFLGSGQADGLLPPETTIATLAENDQAQSAGLTPDVAKKIDADLGVK
jgi:hypothetical protein